MIETSLMVWDYPEPDEEEERKLEMSYEEYYAEIAYEEERLNELEGEN